MLYPYIRLLSFAIFSLKVELLFCRRVARNILLIIASCRADIVGKERSYIRTLVPEGTAFDIAGKNRADASSFLSALFECIDIIQRRNNYEENRKNPLRKMTQEVLANAEDEKIEEQ